MESIKLEAAHLEELVCASKDKQLRVHCHAVSGRGWVEVAGRRFVSKGYVKAARHLHEQNTLELKEKDERTAVYELGHHACSKLVRHANHKHANV